MVGVEGLEHRLASHTDLGGCINTCLTFLIKCISVYYRPEILKQEIKVFFVKYNDPIYVKLEKLDIMIRLASQANIAQVRLQGDSGL